MRVALSQKLREEAVVVVDGFDVEPKTKLFAGLVKEAGWVGSTLIVEDAANNNLRLAARNLPGIKVISPSALSVYDIVRHRRLVLTQGTVAKIGEMFQP